MESEKQHQRSDVEFLEDLVDELFLDIGLEADRLRLADAYTVQDPQKCGNLK